MDCTPLEGAPVADPMGSARQSNRKENKMSRNLKVLGLALLAVFSLAALTASAASAASFHSEKETAVITAEGEKINGTTFGTKSSSVTTVCEKETFAGTAKNGATSITVHPTYFGCNAEPFGAAPIDTKGCNYILYAETTSHLNTSGVSETDAPVEVECEGTNAIKVTAPGCTITVPAQSKRHGVMYVNEGSGSTRDITVKVTVDGIKYTSSGFGCFLGGIKASGEDGLLTGSATAKGFVDNCAVGACPLALTAKEEEEHGTDAYKDTYSEGAQQGIFWE